MKWGQLPPFNLLGCFCRGKMRCHGVLFVSTSAAALLFYFPHTRCSVLQSTHGLQQSWRRKLNIFPASNSCHDAQHRIYLFCSRSRSGSELSKVNNSLKCPAEPKRCGAAQIKEESSLDMRQMVWMFMLQLHQYHNITLYSCNNLLPISVLVPITRAMDWRSRSSWHSPPGAGARGHSGAWARAADCLAFSGARDRTGAMRWKRFVKFYKSICKC